MRKKSNKQKKKAKIAKEAGEKTAVRQPRCLIINRGSVGKDTESLMRDFRKVFEPNAHTYFKNNKMKDLLSVTKPLGCTHLITFSETDLGIYMKFCRLPEGPTITFKIHNFSYTRDVLTLIRRVPDLSKYFLFGPCLMTNLQLEEEKLHLRLATQMFLDIFPSISPTTGITDSIQRCCLFHYDPKYDMFNFRHYAIRIVPLGLSKATRKLVATRKVPDLSKYGEVSEFMTKGTISESEAEDDQANEVTVNDSKPTVRKTIGKNSAVRLYDIGPRLSIELRKVEAGLFGGVVLYHKLVKKTAKEKAELERQKIAKRSLYIQRIKEQERNVQRKIEEREKHKKRCLDGMREFRRANVDGKREEPDDDIQYFREEVGAEPDAALFDKKNVDKKRKPAYVAPWKKKREAEKAEDSSPFSKKRNIQRGPRKTHVKGNLKGNPKGHFKGNLKGNLKGNRKGNLKGRKRNDRDDKEMTDADMRPMKKKKKPFPSGRF